MLEIDASIIDLGKALALTGFGTHILKRILATIWQPGEVSKFAPLLAVLAASLAVALVIDLETATLRDAVLAVVLITAATVGTHSGGKNVIEGVKALTEKKTHGAV
jgi:hypothetical protein